MTRVKGAGEWVSLQNLDHSASDSLGQKKIRAADAKEVRVENPAEETCCYPNQIFKIIRRNKFDP
ncbi:MAG: hypothetical protein HY735_09070 [Verrucomicrobia bacterium]|nr:hypothetical protein [Verrucomicrobiota bacterium]